MGLCSPARATRATVPGSLHWHAHAHARWLLSIADRARAACVRPMQVDLVIGADGANSRVAKDMDAGEYDYAIAFQERIRISDDKMKYYENLAEM